MCLFLDEACSWAEKLFTDIHLPPLMPDEDNNFGGCLVLYLRKWWHHLQPQNSLNYIFFFLDLPGQMFVNLQQMQRNVSKVSSNTDLLAELEKIASDKGFVISDNEGSGNCMFYALSEQLNFVKGIKISHGELRQSIVQHLRKNPNLASLVFLSCIFWWK